MNTPRYPEIFRYVPYDWVSTTSFLTTVNGIDVWFDPKDHRRRYVLISADGGRYMWIDLEDPYEYIGPDQHDLLTAVDWCKAHHILTNP